MQVRVITHNRPSDDEFAGVPEVEVFHDVIAIFPLDDVEGGGIDFITLFDPLTPSGEAHVSVTLCSEGRFRIEHKNSGLWVRRSEEYDDE